MKISLIVPCYNEQEALPIFYRETKKVMESMDCDYEMIFVNDGSKDGTLELLKEFAKEDTHVTYIGFSRNFGKEAAMYAGFCNVTGDYAAVMDADMQDPPSLLPQMLDILENQGYDSVATRRATRKGEPVIRSWFARMFYRLINKISDADIVDGARDFRLMKRSMLMRSSGWESTTVFQKEFLGGSVLRHTGFHMRTLTVWQGKQSGVSGNCFAMRLMV